MRERNQRQHLPLWNTWVGGFLISERITLFFPNLFLLIKTKLQVNFPREPKTENNFILTWTIIHLLLTNPACTSILTLTIWQAQHLVARGHLQGNEKAEQSIRNIRKVVKATSCASWYPITNRTVEHDSWSLAMANILSVSHTCNKDLWVICFRKGHRVKAGIWCIRHLTGGETDMTHSHCWNLAATSRGQKGFLCHLSQSTDYWHLQLTMNKNVFKKKKKSSYWELC